MKLSFKLAALSTTALIGATSAWADDVDFLCYMSGSLKLPKTGI